MWKSFDGKPLISGNITQESKPVDVYIGTHFNTMVFNVIKSSSNPLVLGLSWLDRYNPNIDWNTQKLTFQSNSLDTPIVIGPLSTNVSSSHSSKNSKEPPVKASRAQLPLSIGARAFIRFAKKGNIFAIYATPMPKQAQNLAQLPTQYKEYQDAFEKKNIDILPQYPPYNCGIDLQKSAQPPFGPIYNLLQNKLVALHKYIEENFAKNFI
jgi:hypothetical protein